jgi:uncharacterized protein (TIGR00369 family)
VTRNVDLDQARAAFTRAAAGEREVFGDFFLTRLFGFDITFPAEACEVAFEVQDFMFNPQGTLHGGVLATALDISMGHLIHRHAGPGTTLEMKVQYLAPARSGRVTCHAEALRRGGTWFLRAEARNEGGHLLAYATSTWKLLKTPAQASPKETPA